MEETKAYDIELSSILMEEPTYFEVKGKALYLYPVTLGKSLVIARAIEALDLDPSKNLAEAVLLAMDSKREQLCRILALHTLRGREEVFNHKLVKSRTTLIEKGLKDGEIAKLFLLTLFEIPLHKLYEHINLDVDQRDLAKINKVKEQTNKNSITFGGRSLYGALIVPACEKLNLTPKQVVWDISYRFLQVLMADTINNVYLTDEELKQVHISNDRTVIKMDKDGADAIINSMDWT